MLVTVGGAKRNRRNDITPIPSPARAEQQLCSALAGLSRPWIPIRRFRARCAHATPTVTNITCLRRFRSILNQIYQADGSRHAAVRRHPCTAFMQIPASQLRAARGLPGKCKLCKTLRVMPLASVYASSFFRRFSVNSSPTSFDLARMILSPKVASLPTRLILAL